MEAQKANTEKPLPPGRLRSGFTCHSLLADHAGMISQLA